MKRSVLLLLLLLLLYSCNSKNSGIWVYFNNISHKTISVTFNYAYPEDSTYVISHYMDENMHFQVIRPNETSTFMANYEWGYWEHVIKSFEAEYASFYILDCEQMSHIDSLLSVNKYPLLVRYDFTAEDLQELNFTVFYPPTEQMRNVHMYPPYESFLE